MWHVICLDNMDKKILVTIVIVIIVAIMGFLLFQVAYDEFQNQTSAPYPLPEVVVEDTVTAQESQTMTTPNTKFNVSPDFRIVEPTYSRLPMYDFDPKNNFTEEYANSLPVKLGLNVVSTTTDPVLGKIVISGKDDKNLVIYTDQGELNYTDMGPQTSTSNNSFAVTPDIEIYKTAAENFLTSLSLPNTTFAYDSHSYVSGEGEHVDVTESGRGANLIQLKYKATVGDLPIIDKESSLIPNTITVWLNKTAEIVKLYYEASGTTGNKFGNYELLTTEEIRQDLQTENTKAKLVNGTYPIGMPIQSINVKRAHLAYLSVENYLVPVYILEADVRVEGNRSGTGYLLLEAIKK